MRDPMTVAFEIRSPFPVKRKSLTLDGYVYHPPILTIWHCDPEKDGTDDSCGWFIRVRHGDKKMFEQIVKDFKFNFEHNYWFNADGMPIFSTSGILLNMYKAVTWKLFDCNRKKQDAFFRKHLHDIIYFAENPTDSLHTDITREMYYRSVEHDPKRVESRDERIRNLASIVYTDVLRKIRPWYKHPRWHIHHWSIQFHPFQKLKRRYWDKCCVCGKRGFKGSAYSDWDGTKIWHDHCKHVLQKPPILEPKL